MNNMRKNKDIDSFLREHLDSIPKMEITDDDEKQIISNIILNAEHGGRKTRNFFSPIWQPVKKFTQNIYARLRSDRFHVLLPQFGLLLLFIIAVSVFLIIKFTGSNVPKNVAVAEKQKTKVESEQKQTESQKPSKQELAKAETENQIETLKLESIPLIYSERGRTQDTTINNKKLEAAFSVITGVLKDSGVSIENKVNNKSVITQWVINTGSAKGGGKQERLIFKINSGTKCIDVNIEQKPKEIATNKRKNLNNIYKKIDTEVYQMMELCN